MAFGETFFKQWRVRKRLLSFYFYFQTHVSLLQRFQYNIKYRNSETCVCMEINVKCEIRNQEFLITTHGDNYIKHEMYTPLQGICKEFHFVF